MEIDWSQVTDTELEAVQDQLLLWLVEVLSEQRRRRVLPTPVHDLAQFYQTLRRIMLDRLAGTS